MALTFTQRRWTLDTVIPCLLLTLVSRTGFAQPDPGYVEMGWNDTYYFGPDGPWQAVQVEVDGIPMSLTPTVKASGHGSWIPSSQLCTATSPHECGVGGQLDSTPQAVDNYDFSWQETTDSYSLSLEGLASKASFNTGALSNPQQQWDSTFTTLSQAKITYPNHRTSIPELGFFSMGVSWAQVHAWEIEAGVSYCDDSSCSPISYLWSQKVIRSISWGMHLGSAALRYPGSLLLGGYDKGRAIGPLVISQLVGDNSDAFALKDIMLGVSTGGSPYKDQAREKARLLLTTEGDSSPILSNPLVTQLTTDFPYIFLPQATLGALTEELPIFFDSESSFYLWDTKDPTYETLITSPAYLGFVFNDTGGANVTIKVPMALLNLTLESSVSGLGSDVPYFPIMDNAAGNDVQAASTVYLGKAFLQAAFWGSNWLSDNTTNSVSWLAQAPGPGKGNQGLGHEPTVIENRDTSLDVHMGDNLFNQSWTGHWTPLPLSGEETGQKGNKAHDTGLEGGAIAGIVIGAVVAVAAIAAMAFFCIPRKTQKPVSQSRRPEERYSKPELHGESRGEMDGVGVMRERELDATAVMYETDHREIHELEHPRSELRAWPTLSRAFARRLRRQNC